MARRTGYNQTMPTNKAGNLYYVRLNTECGVFYKLGFTTMRTVQARFEYGGSNDYQYIEKILLFVNLKDAFDVEQQLHSYLSKKKAFGKYSAAEEFPLSKNGQTELYIDDVLNLDPDFTESQSKDTARILKSKRLLIAGKTDEQGRRQDLFVSITVPILLILFAPVSIVFIIVMSILEGKNTKNELLEFWDRMTGNKRQIAKEEIELKKNLESIMHRLNYERSKQGNNKW